MAVGSVTYKGGVFKKRSVYFTGSTAVTAGYGYAYNFDAGTAANVDEERNWQVEVLTYANCHMFAGYAVASKPAKTGGQIIEIYEPGGLGYVYTSETTVTLGSAAYVLHCRADGTAPGVSLVRNGPRGPGSAYPLQTLSAAGLCLCKLDDGLQNGCMELLTVTAGGATNMIAHGGTSCFATATVASDATFTLASGSFHGQRRSFQVEGTLTTSDVDITLVGMKADGTTTFTHWKGDADAEDLNVVWDGQYWIAGVAGTGAYS